MDNAQEFFTHGANKKARKTVIVVYLKLYFAITLLIFKRMVDQIVQDTEKKQSLKKKFLTIQKVSSLILVVVLWKILPALFNSSYLKDRQSNSRRFVKKGKKDGGKGKGKK